MNSSFVDFFSFNFIVDVPNAPEMTLQDGIFGVDRRTTLFSINGNAIHLSEILKSVTGALFERQLACHIMEDYTESIVIHRG